MRKIFLVGIAVCLMMGCIKQQPARADTLKISEIISKIKANTGVAYSAVENDWQPTTTLDLLFWKGFTLEGGYRAKDQTILNVSYELTNLQKWGIQTPILNLIIIKPYIWFGAGRWEGLDLFDKDKLPETDFGVGCNIISFKW